MILFKFVLWFFMSLLSLPHATLHHSLFLEFFFYVKSLSFLFISCSFPFLQIQYLSLSVSSFISFFFVRVCLAYPFLKELLLKICKNIENLYHILYSAITISSYHSSSSSWKFHRFADCCRALFVSRVSCCGGTTRERNKLLNRLLLSIYDTQEDDCSCGYMYAGYDNNTRIFIVFSLAPSSIISKTYFLFFPTEKWRSSYS